MKIIFDLIEVTDRLSEMDLSVDLLSKAVRFGEAKRDSCTSNDPKILPSILAWAGTIRKLRDDAPSNWWPSEQELSLILNGSERIVIGVASGDENTGNSDAAPTTKRSVGIETQRAVERNRQGLLDLKFKSPQQVPPSNCLIYLLLRRRVKDAIFWELSAPDGVGIDGRIIRWSERIIFPPISLEPSPLSTDEEDSANPTVQVKRKSK